MAGCRMRVGNVAIPFPDVKGRQTGRIAIALIFRLCPLRALASRLPVVSSLHVTHLYVPLTLTNALSVQPIRSKTVVSEKNALMRSWESQASHGISRVSWIHFVSNFRRLL